MFNHTTDAKAFVTAACTLAIALLTIGIGVNSTWAGSPDPRYLSHSNPSATSVPFRYAQNCVPTNGVCFAPGMQRPQTCCPGKSCSVTRRNQPGYLFCSN